LRGSISARSNRDVPRDDHLSKRGNARLRYAFWMAGTIAIRMQQNTFRRKFEDYIRPDPQSADRRRKGYTAVAAKMAGVVYAAVTTGIDDRRFPEARDQEEGSLRPVTHLDP
jgi:hypothetical protein